MEFYVFRKVRNHSEVASVHKFQSENKEMIFDGISCLVEQYVLSGESLLFASPLLLSFWLLEAQVEVFQHFHISWGWGNPARHQIKIS
jgi:hypothetical protein